ncbi:NAD-dependent succinate-semialdehyde dehydrogenase [Aliikangiella coralliicola]|uniref:NAD-dependent succinate-semialdehyde dehydrogenase n=1 Tax=Aliikangiella coralliicola TaxID=2592383 RepID=UPI001AEFB561
MQLNNLDLWKTSSFVNGEWEQAHSSFKVENPANRQIIAEIDEVTPEQLELAVNSAYQALAKWQQKTVDERATLLRRWFELIIANQADLAAIMTAEQGKPMPEASGEVVYGANYIRWYAEEARRINGDVLPVNQAGRRALVLKRPIGVVTAITPWNFPSSMILRKAAAALAAGCTFVVKPSELTPLSALALAQLSSDAGIPAGVFNVVVGSNAQPIGEILTTHPKVAKFSFTGSTFVGKKLLHQCASTVKKTSMELGGNAPYIAFDDADLEVAVKGAMGSKFRNSGQTCVSANRIFVHKTIHDEFVARLQDKVAELKIGEGTNEGINIGPLIEPKAVEKVEQLVNQAVESGAEIVCGGTRVQGEGNFYQPTILTGVSADMDIFNCEIFGPVASIIPFESEEEVVRLANQTNYGLCSYVFTQNLNRIWRLSEKLEFGMVGINEGVLSNPAAPFGGIKESGMGREGGRWGIEDYLETRYVCMGNIS